MVHVAALVSLCAMVFAEPLAMSGEVDANCQVPLPRDSALLQVRSGHALGHDAEPPVTTAAAAPEAKTTEAAAPKAKTTPAATTAAPAAAATTAATAAETTAAPTAAENTTEAAAENTTAATTTEAPATTTSVANETNATCLTRKDERAQAWWAATAEPGTPCVFGMDVRDEGKHCIPEFDFGSHGWCFTKEDKSEWGSCNPQCPLYGPSKVLGDRITEVKEEIGDVIQDLKAAANVPTKSPGEKSPAEFLANQSNVTVATTTTVSQRG